MPTLTLRLSAGPQAASMARRALTGLEPHMDRPLLDDVRLLVTELVTNSVRHSGIGTEATVDLEVTVSPRLLRVEVRDEGAGFRPPVPARRGEAVSGWGLYLVDRLADRWGVAKEDATRVWFEIDRKQVASA